MLTLNESEMLSLWLLKRYGAELRDDCNVSRVMGIDLKKIAKTEMEVWYANLLMTADPDLLMNADLSAEVALQPAGENALRVYLPSSFRRLLDVEVAGWNAPARIVTDPADPELRRMANPFAAPDVYRPLCLLEHNRLTLYGRDGVSAYPTLTRLFCVVAPPEGTYVFDASLISTIPELTDFPTL